MVRNPQPALTFIKGFLILILFQLYLLTISSGDVVYAQTTCSCDSDEYVCQYGEMCCTGGGCPSWVCEKDGGTPTTNPPDCPDYDGDGYNDYNPSGGWTCCDYNDPWTYSITVTSCSYCGESCGSWYNCDCETVCCSDPNIPRDWCERLGDTWGCTECDLCRDCFCRTCPRTYTCTADCNINPYWTTNNTCRWCSGGDDPPPPLPDCSCVTPPGPADLVTPDEGYTTVDTNVVDFGWLANGWGEECCGGRGFRVQLDNDSDFSSPEYFSEILPSSSTDLTATIEAPEGQKYWRVQSRNEAGETWSAPRSLILDYIPPTAEITSPADGATLSFGTNYSFSSHATDAVGPLTRMQLFRAKETSPGVYGSPIQLDQPSGGDQSCFGGGIGTECDITREWTPTSADIGTWVIYMTAFDNLEAYGGKCTGSPISIPADFDDCGRDGLLDYITVTVQNSAPNITGINGDNFVRLGDPATGYRPDGSTTNPGYIASEFSQAQRVGLFNLNYSEPNNQAVNLTWASPNCTLNYPSVQSISVYVGGTPCNGDPEMIISYGDESAGGFKSSTHNIVTEDITAGQWGIYTVPVGGNNITSIDVAFINDYNQVGVCDRNLYVDYIEIDYANPDVSITRLEAEAANVIYDRGVGDEAYDGNDIFTGSFSWADGESMAWDGSLRFPVPLGFIPSLPFAGGVRPTCSLTATATDSGWASTTSNNFDVTIYGDYPSEATNISPTDGATDTSYDPVTFEWNPPTYLGDIFSGNVQNSDMTYTVYAIGGQSGGAGNCADPSAGGYTAVDGCIGISGGTTTCSGVGFFDRDQDYCWFVASSNGEYESTSNTWAFETSDPVFYQNWAAALNGSFYTNSLTIELPDSGAYISHPSPWGPPPDGPYLTYDDDGNAKSIFLTGSSQIPIVTYDNSSYDQPFSDSDIYAHATSGDAKFSSYAWPSSRAYNKNDFTPPDHAIDLSEGADCSSTDIFAPDNHSNALDSKEVYKIDVSCANDTIVAVGVDAEGVYDTKQPETTVVYVTGSGDLRFQNRFISSDNQGGKRILFVTGPNIDVVIDKDLGLAAEPDKNTEPLIQAAFLINGDLTFETNMGPTSDPEVDNDPASIMVEGPLVVNGHINFLRNRGLQNTYPAEIVKYNSKYLYYLTEQERKLGSIDDNYTGLFTYDVEWTIEE